MNKSKSSAATSTNQETNQLSSDGIVAGDLFQGKTFTINQEFSENVANAFSQLVELTQGAINLAHDTGAGALELVTMNEQTESNPEITAMEKFLPVIMLGIAAATVVLIFRKR